MGGATGLISLAGAGAVPVVQAGRFGFKAATRASADANATAAPGKVLKKKTHKRTLTVTPSTAGLRQWAPRRSDVADASSRRHRSSARVSSLSALEASGGADLAGARKQASTLSSPLVELHHSPAVR